MKKAYNIIFTPISITHGMAGTKRLKNITHYLSSETFQTSNYVIEGNSFEKFLRAVNLCIILYKKRSNRKINVLYHYSNINLQTFIPCIIAKILRYKLIVDLVEDYTQLDKNELHTKGKIRVFIIILLQATYKKLVDGFVTISKHLELYAGKIGREYVPIIHIPVSFNPVDFSNLQKKKIEGFENNFIIFYGGSFGDKDGLEYLLPAFDKLAATYSDVVLITTGIINKNYVSNYDFLKSKMKYKDRVFDMGYVSEEKYHEIILNSDVLCMTRKNSGFAQAGFPFKLAAFLVTGNPVLVTNVSNISDYLTPKNCFLIKPNSINHIYDGLCSIKENMTQANQIGIKGKKTAYKYFNASLHLNKLSHFFSQL